jgi:hypothetical protein
MLTILRVLWTAAICSLLAVFLHIVWQQFDRLSVDEKGGVAATAILLVVIAALPWMVAHAKAPNVS